FEHGQGIGQVGTRSDTDTADLGSQGVGNVVAVQVQRGDHVVLGRAQQNLLQERVGDRILDDDLATGLGILELAPRAAVDQLGAEFFAGQFVAPVTEATFRELHDVALVHQRDRGTVVIDGVLDGLAHQALGAFAGNGLNADTGGFGEADLVDAQFLLQEVDELAGFGAAGFELDTGIDVFGVLAEDDHVGLFRLAHGRRHALEVLNGAQTHVQVELLAQGDVQRTDAATDGCGERTLDRDNVFTDRVERFVGQPDVGAVHLGGLFTVVDFHPVNLALAALRLRNCSGDDLEHVGRDVGDRNVAIDEGNDGLIRHIEGKIGVDRDLLALGGNLDMLIRHECSRVES